MYRIENNTWTEYGTTWNNRPQEVGTLVTRLEDGHFMEVDVSEHVTPGAVNNFVIRDDVGDAEFRSRESANPPELVVMTCGGCGCKGATPFVAASSSVSTFAMALVGALLPKRRRKERRET